MTRTQRAKYTKKIGERLAHVTSNTCYELGLRPKKSIRRLLNILLEEAHWMEQRILEGKL